VDSVKIEATERSPALVFDFAANRFVIQGESYPEDVNAFYGPLLEKLTSHFAALSGAEIQFDFSLVYFNSSTAKILMTLFEMLEETAQDNQTTITWAYEEGDDAMQEMGEEFAEDLERAQFVLTEMPTPR
jgi:hypothetical protein